MLDIEYKKLMNDVSELCRNYVMKVDGTPQSKTDDVVKVCIKNIVIPVASLVSASSGLDKEKLIDGIVNDIAKIIKSEIVKLRGKLNEQ